MSRRGFDILTTAECEQHLRATSFGRVVAKVADILGAWPVYYVVDDAGDILFRTDPGTKLAAAVLRTRVTFEIDDEAEGWSVMAMGYSEELRTSDALTRALDALEEHWPASERQRVVKIHPERITGRRLQSPAFSGR
jgi:nitroimidazol reductase NimA-like FMN-containing flavoprotein (pyridoxamine 5'-phosphate oxidase superfamily)